MSGQLVDAGSSDSDTRGYRLSYMTPAELKACATSLKSEYLRASEEYGFDAKRLRVLDRELTEY